jgi:hypothetical protein
MQSLCEGHEGSLSNQGWRMTLRLSALQKLMIISKLSLDAIAL